MPLALQPSFKPDFHCISIRLAIPTNMLLRIPPKAGLGYPDRSPVHKLKRPILHLLLLSSIPSLFPRNPLKDHLNRPTSPVHPFSKPSPNEDSHQEHVLTPQEIHPRPRHFHRPPSELPPPPHRGWIPLVQELPYRDRGILSPSKS